MSRSDRTKRPAEGITSRLAGDAATCSSPDLQWRVAAGAFAGRAGGVESDLCISVLDATIGLNCREIPAIGAVLTQSRLAWSQPTWLARE